MNPQQESSLEVLSALLISLQKEEDSYLPRATSYLLFFTDLKLDLLFFNFQDIA
jgi:hypothetical protein